MKKTVLLFALLLFTGTLFAQAPASGTTKAGKFQMNFPDLGSMSDSVVLWDGTTKVLKYIPRSSFVTASPDLQEVTNTGATTTNQIDIQGVQIGGTTNTVKIGRSITGNTAGNSVLIGFQAGQDANATDQIAIGNSSGYDNSGTAQISIGTASGESNIGGFQTAIGYYAGSQNTGANQIAIGNAAGIGNTFNNTIHFSTDASGSTATANNQIVINTNGNDIIFNTNVATDVGPFDYPPTGDRWALFSELGSGGSTNLTYTASPTDGSVNSDTGTDATIPLADVTNAGLLSPSEKTSIGTISSKEDTANKQNSLTTDGTGVKYPTVDAVNAGIAAITGVQDVKTAKIANSVEVIKTGFEYGFDDFAGYTPFTTMTKTVGTTKGIKIVTTVDNFLPTGKIIDNNVYSVTVSAKCTAGATGYFGFGIKNGSSWGGMQWRGSTGATALLQYNSSSFVSAASAGTQATFTTGDIISIQLIFNGAKSFLRFAKNGVWNVTEYTAPATAPAMSGGELVLAIRGSSTWDDIVVKVEDVNEYSKFVFVAPPGAGVSDSNNGTFDSPMATIQEAKYKTKGIGKVVLKTGDYLDQYFTTALGLNLTADTGATVRLIYGTRFTSASIVGGTTKVYSVSYAPTLDSSDAIWQHDVADANTVITQAESHPLQRGLTNRLPSSKSTWLASTALLEASSNSETHFFWSAGTLYFTIISGSSLATNPIVVPDSGDEIQVFITHQPTVTMQNINFLYRSVRLSSTKFKIEDSSVLCSANSFGWQYGNSIGGEFIRCRAGGINYNLGIGGDGFNGTATFTTTVKSTDSWSHDNEDDGDSLHSNCSGSIYGGLYEYNGGGVVAASGGHISIFNAIMRNSGQGVGSQGATADAGNSTNILASGCLMQGNSSNSTASSGWIRTTLINCIAKGNDFPAGADKWNCIYIP